MKLIDKDALNERMYHDAFETDSDMQKWDGGCWIRYKMFENAIKDAPTVEERKWIPCSERMPYMWDERYLVSLAWGGIGVMEYKSTGFHNYGSFTPVPIESITAWMPLPEPYEERRGE